MPYHVRVSIDLKINVVSDLTKAYFVSSISLHLIGSIDYF